MTGPGKSAGAGGVAPDDTVEVRLVGLPLALFELASEHSEELHREFALLALRPPDDPDHALPRRLLDLIAALGQRYGGFTADTDALRDAAAAEGRSTIDLTYRVPRSVATAARELGDLLDEADEFCRRGDLLTLETPPAAVALRRWYLDQFIGQIETGAPPEPWSEFERRLQGSPF